MTGKYKENILEPGLKLEYIKKARKIMKEKPIKIGTIEDFRKKFIKN